MPRSPSGSDLELETLNPAAQQDAAPPKRGVSRRHQRWMTRLASFVLVCALFWLTVAIYISESARRAAKLQREFALSLSRIAERTIGTQRGIVMPLYDHIAALGLSNVLSLRALGVDLPLEVPHCGDLSVEFRQLIMRHDPHARVYDVCAAAFSAVNEAGSNEPLFCPSLRKCHKLFRDFNIKILAVLFSQFDEIMLLDADTIFFQSPAPLWNLPHYKRTGTLFFPDRISMEDDFLALRVANTSDGRPVSHLHSFLATFDVSPFQSLATIPRAPATTPNLMPTEPRVAPSDFLLTSHAWNLRAGHEMDSSLVLWSKARQPRATAILASFVSQNGADVPPSYGDKELYFIACELAETQYAFADFGVGTLGTSLRSHNNKSDSVLCGECLHYFPDNSSDARGQPLYYNSEYILALDVTGDKEIYRTVARPTTFYPGSFADAGLPQECPFDITAVPLTANEKAAFKQRQAMYAMVQHWEEEARGFANNNSERMSTSSKASE